MYTIKQISEITGISAYTIRFYDNKGLLPFLMRDKNNIRLFSENDLDWLNFIHCLRNTGMPIADIKKYIELCNADNNTIKERYNMIIAQKAKIENEIIKMQKRIEILDNKINCYKDLLDNPESDSINSYNCKSNENPNSISCLNSFIKNKI
ncbi:MAG TPA: MerR family transcriptional regulator [Clostridium sp.]|nr:MerR family transcriptional regulator [Clostridium sp.]